MRVLVEQDRAQEKQVGAPSVAKGSEEFCFHHLDEMTHPRVWEPALLPQISQSGSAVQLLHTALRETGRPSTCETGLLGLTLAFFWPEMATPILFPMRKVKFAALYSLSLSKERSGALPPFWGHTPCCSPVLGMGEFL